jgi:hypothetical protein
MQIKFSAENLVGREHELKLFEELLQFPNEARLLTVSIKGAHGKSVLLKKMQLDCTNQHSIPVALVDLKEDDKPTPFAVVRKIIEDIEEGFPLVEFRNFNELNHRRMDKDPASFRRSASPGPARMQGVLYGPSGVSGSNNVFAGVGVGNVNTMIVNPVEWTADLEAEAQKQCITAFYRDLKEVCQETPLVLLMDSWDGCRNEEVRKWVHTFLRQSCFDLKNRPDRLVFVLAGRPDDFPNFKSLYGEKYERVVRPVEQFQEWGNDQLRDFLRVNGLDGLDAGDIATINSTRKNKEWDLLVTIDRVQGFFGN